MRKKDVGGGEMAWLVPLSRSQRPGSEVMLTWDLRKPPESTAAAVTLSPRNVAGPLQVEVKDAP